MSNQLPQRPTTRNKVLDVIDGERDYQVKHFPDSPVPTLPEFANMLIEYTDKLAVDVTVDSSSPTGGPLKRLREIAAIAIHAMEVYGAQPRENHVPASAGITGVANIVAKSDSVKPVPKPTVIVQPPRPSAPAPTLHPQPGVHAPGHPAAVQHKPEPVPHTTQHGGEKK